MKHRVLGSTGMSVSEIGLGTMMFGAMGNADHDETVAIIRTALDAGMNLIDTADVYSLGESEEIVGKAIKGRRDDIVLATKFGLPMGADANHGGGSRRWIVRAAEDSLRRLGTEYIDLYQMHRPDAQTDIDETLAALSDLVRSGKVRAIGSSTFHPELMVEAQWAAEKGGHQSFRTEQPRYSMLARAAEESVLPTAQRYGMGVLTYSPMSGGWLSGRPDPTLVSYRALLVPAAFDLAVVANQGRLAAVGRLTQLAAEAGLSMTQLATAFVRSHPAVSSVLIGPRTPEQMQDLLAGIPVELTEDVLDAIDEIVPPGADLNPADSYLATPAAIMDKRLRRREPVIAAGQLA